ncbi:hypothetical protein, partial [Hoylesella marshii]|uniref:hypothetical protein n=1 Tax=Hoylesella marshii TaxID=189722 RepID=UPI0028D171C1
RGDGGWRVRVLSPFQGLDSGIPRHRGCAIAYPCLPSVAPLGLLDKTLLSRTRIMFSSPCTTGMADFSPSVGLLSDIASP